MPDEKENTESLAAAAGIYLGLIGPRALAIVGHHQLQEFRDLVLEDAALQIEAMKPAHVFDIGDYAATIRGLKSGS